MFNVKKNEPYFKKIDYYCALIGIMMGLLVVFLSIFGFINQIIIGLTIICISLIYISMRPKIRSQRVVAPLSISSRSLSVLNIVFWLLLTVTLFIWHSNIYYRPTPYFIIISILSVIVALEIISSRDSNRILPIFVKIVILSLVIRGGIFFNYPSIMGYDAYFHTDIADIIMLSGSVPPFEISDKYAYAPIVHILIANVGVLCHIPVKYAVFLSIGIVSVISTLFLYLVGKHIAGPQIGLLAVLLANLTNDLIVRGIANITADSLVICYLLVMLFLVFAKTLRPITRDSLLIFFSLLLVITHQLSTFVVFLIMLTLVSSRAIISYIQGVHDQKTPSTAYLSLFGIAIISYWVIMEFPNGTTFFEYVMRPFINVLESGGRYGSDLLIVGRVYEQPLSDRLILQFSYLILPFFAIGGLLLWSSIENRERFSIAIAGAALFVMVYGIPLLGIRNLITSRWMPLLSIFLSLLAAAFIWRLINLASRKSRKILAITLIVFIFAFLMITTPAINKDNPLVSKETTVRNQFTYSEIQAVRTISSMHDGETYVDSAFSSAYQYYMIPDSARVYTFSISGNNDRIRTNDLFVLRTSTLYEPIYVKASDLYADTVAQVIPQTFFDEFESGHYNKVYDGGPIICHLSL